MLLDLYKQIINIEGNEITDENGNTFENNLLSKILGSLLFARCDELGDAVKFNDIGEKLYKDGKIEIDDSDLEKIARFTETFKVREGDVFPGHIRAAIIREIKNTRLSAVAEKNK